MRPLLFSALLLVYFVSGLSLTLFNKFILAPERYGFHFPVTLILCHMAANCVLSGVAVRCCLSDLWSSSAFSPSRIKMRYFLTRVAPVGLLFGLDITLTNVAFRFISVSLTEVVKSMIPALIFLSDVCRGVDKAVGPGEKSAKALNVVLIVLGVACMAAGETKFHWGGFAAALGATFAGATKLVAIEGLLGGAEHSAAAASGDAESDDAEAEAEAEAERDTEHESLSPRPRSLAEANKPASLTAAALATVHRVEVVGSPRASAINGNGSGAGYAPVTSVAAPVALHHGAHGGHKRLHPILSLFYFTPVSALALLPLQLLAEGPSLSASPFAHGPKALEASLVVLSGALVAFALNSAELVVIKETSALTLCVLGVAKFLLVVLLSAAMFDSPLTKLNLVGVALALAGLVVYNWGRLREAKRATAAAASAAAAAAEAGKDLATDSGSESAAELFPSSSSPRAGRGGEKVPRADSMVLESLMLASSSESSSAGSVDGLLPPRSSPHASGPKRPVGERQPPSPSASSSDIGDRLMHAFDTSELHDAADGDDASASELTHVAR